MCTCFSLINYNCYINLHTWHESKCYFLLFISFSEQTYAHSQITKTIKPVLCPSLLCCVNIWANEINDCTAFDWLLLVLINTPRKTQHKELQYVPVINILIGWPPFLWSLPSITQTPSPPLVPLQLQVQVLYQISLKKSCKTGSSQCVNLWLEREKSGFQGREASMKVNPQADSRRGCFNLKLILLNTEIESCKMLQIASLAGWWIWVLEGGRPFLKSWMVTVSRKAGGFPDSPQEVGWNWATVPGR